VRGGHAQGVGSARGAGRLVDAASEIRCSPGSEQESGTKPLWPNSADSPPDGTGTVQVLLDRELRAAELGMPSGPAAVAEPVNGLAQRETELGAVVGPRAGEVTRTSCLENRRQPCRLQRWSVVVGSHRPCFSLESTPQARRCLGASRLPQARRGPNSLSYPRIPTRPPPAARRPRGSKGDHGGSCQTSVFRAPASGRAADVCGTSLSPATSGTKRGSRKKT
jgi:hypothetical protein